MVDRFLELGVLQQWMVLFGVVIPPLHIPLAMYQRRRDGMWDRNLGYLSQRTVLACYICGWIALPLFALSHLLSDDRLFWIALPLGLVLLSLGYLARVRKPDG